MNMNSRKGFIQIPLLVIALVALVSGGTGIVLYSQGKLDSFVASVSQVLQKTEKTNEELELSQELSTNSKSEIQNKESKEAKLESGETKTESIKTQEENAVSKLNELLEQQNKRTEKIRDLYLEWANVLLVENNNVKNAWLKIENHASDNLVAISGISGKPADAIRLILQNYTETANGMVVSENGIIGEIKNVRDIVAGATHFNDYQKYEAFFKKIADHITESARRYDQVVKLYNSDISFIKNSLNASNSTIKIDPVPQQTTKTCLFSVEGSVIKDYYSGSVKCYPF